MKELFFSSSCIKMEIFIMDGCFDDSKLNMLYKSLIIYSVPQKPLVRNKSIIRCCTECKYFCCWPLNFNVIKMLLRALIGMKWNCAVLEIQISKKKFFLWYFCVRSLWCFSRNNFVGSWSGAKVKWNLLF